MNQQAAAPLAHRRERGPIHTDSAEHVDIEHLLELFGRVCLGDADARHTGIIDDDIQAPRVVESCLHSIPHGFVVGHVELEHLQA
jgi:hypothetical protein